MTTANLSGLVGVTNDSASATALFPLGTTVVIGNFPYTYAQAAAAVAAAGTVTLTGGFVTSAGSTHTHDVGGVGVPINYFAFFKRVVSPL